MIINILFISLLITPLVTTAIPKHQVLERATRMAQSFVIRNQHNHKVPNKKFVTLHQRLENAANKNAILHIERKAKLIIEIIYFAQNKHSMSPELRRAISKMLNDKVEVLQKEKNSYHKIMIMLNNIHKMI